jgi:hypothetical protein
MPMTLQISRELSLPAEAVSETFAILAKRGAGKTHIPSDLVVDRWAHMLRVAQPVISR